MKLLLLHTHDYWLSPFERNAAVETDENAAIISCRDAVVALIHVESIDEENPDKIATKGLKHIKWLCRKVGTEMVVLHSFAHLATSKAHPDTARKIIQSIANRLASAGFTVQITPFGFFNEFKMHVAGPSLAKVFIDI